MYEQYLAALKEALPQSRELIMEVYHTDFAVEIKDDDSPVTKADKANDAFLRDFLSKRFPDIGFLTEESMDTKERLHQKAIWIIDPVDGTSEFVHRTGEFTVNIALCVDHEIVLGVIYAPVLNRLYYAIKGQGAYVEQDFKDPVRIHVSDKDFDLKAMRSISHFNEKEKAFMERNNEKFSGEATPVGAALKFAYLAEGKFDFYIRISGGTKEWDVASGDLILSEAGGVMVEPDGSHLTYNREDVYNRNGYVMANKESNLLLGM